ncbi:MAG: NAD(P)H-dependent oxidoreductase [Solobacterium sp.]|nr:NAD(P)H-dependent oxidoreductase [Solobacterium sp.]
MSKILTVYYSRKGENYFGGEIRSIAKGNTERVAEYINEAVGGDLFELETVREYSKDYHECTNEAMDEKKADARPELKKLPASIDEYDTIFLGYPNWWSTAPMAVFTFLDAFDFTGKTIIPFCTNEGSGLGSSESDIRRECPGAKVEAGLSIRGSQAADSKSKVTKWALSKIK